MKPYLNTILDHNPEGNIMPIGNEILPTSIPQTRCSYYYKTAQSQWRDVA